MKINVLLERESKSKQVSLESKGTVLDLLLKLKINPETVLVVKKGNVVINDTILKDKDEVKILSVVSGG